MAVTGCMPTSPVAAMRTYLPRRAGQILGDEIRSVVGGSMVGGSVVMGSRTSRED